jgi:hypothetical protein
MVLKRITLPEGILYNKEFVSKRRIIPNASFVNVVMASHARNRTYYGLFPKCFAG